MNAVYPARSTQVAARMLGDETIIMSPRDATLFSLNGVGSLIWQAADGQTSLDRIVERVSHEFDVSPEVALEDTASFLDELASHGILSLADQPAVRGPQ
jgi:Coenzyme PQQ synthesis protein D (PqqD)